MISKTANWFSDIVSYFRFVSARREDISFALFPIGSKSIFSMVTFLIVTGLLIVYVDPVLLAWVREPDRHYPVVFQFITRLGKVHWILASSGIVLILLSLFRANRFKGHKSIVWHRIFLNVWFAFTAVAYSGLLVTLLKNIFGRARPQFTPENYIWLYRPFEFQYEFASFPSGHATTGGAIAMVLVLLFPRWRWFFIPAAVLIAISRPILGVHFPSDVMAGVIFGAGFVWLYARVFARKRLLFEVGESGRLNLRGEGKGKMHLLKPMIGEILTGKGDHR